jgi:hypothetical protein
MIPEKLTDQALARLTELTASGEIRWVVQSLVKDTERYIYQRGPVLYILLFTPSRAAEDRISLGMLDQGTNTSATLITADQEAGEDYDRLERLLFQIRRQLNVGNFKNLTDNLLGLLPQEERAEWEKALAAQ